MMPRPRSCGEWMIRFRDLFELVRKTAVQLPQSDIQEVKTAFEAFAQEFESMIFKEESILLMILLETFTHKMTG